LGLLAAASGRKVTEAEQGLGGKKIMATRIRQFALRMAF